MKNRLSDLNNHLFAQIERLNDEELTSDEINIEAKRSKAMVAVAEQIIEGASVTVKANQLAHDMGIKVELTGAIAPPADFPKLGRK